jgi:hypothetical protein
MQQLLALDSQRSSQPPSAQPKGTSGPAAATPGASCASRAVSPWPAASPAPWVGARPAAAQPRLEKNVQQLAALPPTLLRALRLGPLAEPAGAPTRDPPGGESLPPSLPLLTA